jgi:hypothetical protein
MDKAQLQIEIKKNLQSRAIKLSDGRYKINARTTATATATNELIIQGLPENSYVGAEIMVLARGSAADPRKSVVYGKDQFPRKIVSYDRDTGKIIIDNPFVGGGDFNASPIMVEGLGCLIKTANPPTVPMRRYAGRLSGIFSRI